MLVIITILKAAFDCPNNLSTFGTCRCAAVMTQYLSSDEDLSLEAELAHTMYYLMILKVGLF